MDTGGWTPRRLAIVATMAFCGGLGLTLLLAPAGALPVAAVLVAVLAGGAWVARGGRSTDPHPPASPLPSPPRIAAAPAPPALPQPVRVAPPGPDLVVATVVHSEAELDAMLTDMPPCWRHAAFVSVMVQRRDAVSARVRDARMGFAQPGGERVETEFETAAFFADRLAELGDVTGQVEDFLLSRAFHEVFGADEASADPDGIRQAAHRLMDFHERALALCERCRGVTVPPHCRDLQRDFGRLTALPLDGFDQFIADFSERVEEAGDVARYATGDVQLDPVSLSIADDADLLGRVSRRMQQLVDRT